MKRLVLVAVLLGALLIVFAGTALAGGPPSNYGGYQSGWYGGGNYGGNYGGYYSGWYPNYNCCCYCYTYTYSYYNCPNQNYGYMQNYGHKQRNYGYMQNTYQMGYGSQPMYGGNGYGW